jgi:uncharacterized membrane protein
MILIGLVVSVGITVGVFWDRQAASDKILDKFPLDKTIGVV